MDLFIDILIDQYIEIFIYNLKIMKKKIIYFFFNYIYIYYKCVSYKLLPKPKVNLIDLK